jgi:hypothetical protein
MDPEGWSKIVTQLMPVTQTTQEAEIRRISIQGQPWQIVLRPCLENIQLKEGLDEWHKL